MSDSIVVQCACGETLTLPAATDPVYRYLEWHAWRWQGPFGSRTWRCPRCAEPDPAPDSA